MTLLGTVTLLVLCSPLFGVLASVDLEFALELAAMLSISATVALGIPALEVDLAIAAAITLGIDVAVSIGLPSATVDLGLGINAELALVLGLIATLSALLAIGGAALQAYTFNGPGSSMGSALDAALTRGWPDGTPPANDVEALILVATSTGTVPAGAVASATLLGGGEGYEPGLCSVTFSPPPAGVTAQGRPVLSGGVLTGITITNPGFGYPASAPPTIQISDSTPLVGVTNASPIVVTLADTTGIGAVTIANAKGPAAAGLNGQWYAQALTGTTAALWKDSGFTRPSVGSGPWVRSDGGTVTGAGCGAAAAAVMGGGAVAHLKGFFDGLTWGSGLLAAGSLALSSILDVGFGLMTDLLANLEVRASILGQCKLNFGVVPPTVAGNASVVAGIDANVTAALQFVPPLPSIQAQLLAGVNGEASIVGRLVARIGLLLGFTTETIAVYSYRGPGSGLGSAIASKLSSADATVALLAATTPEASAAISTFFPMAA